MNRWTLSFQQKLTGVTMLASAMALVLTFATLLPLRRAELVQDERTNLESLAQVIGDSSKAALSFRDERVGREALAGLAATPRIVAAGIYTADGRVWLVYSGPRTGKDPLPPQPGPPGSRFDGGAATVFHPVTMDGEQLGTVVSARGHRTPGRARTVVCAEPPAHHGGLRGGGVRAGGQAAGHPVAADRRAGGGGPPRLGGGRLFPPRSAVGSPRAPGPGPGLQRHARPHRRSGRRPEGGA